MSLVLNEVILLLSPIVYSLVRSCMILQLAPSTPAQGEPVCLGESFRRVSAFSKLASVYQLDSTYNYCHYYNFITVAVSWKQLKLAASSYCTSPTNEAHRPKSVQAFIQAQSPARSTPHAPSWGRQQQPMWASFAPTPIAGLHDSRFDPIKLPFFTEICQRAIRAWTSLDAAVLELAAAGCLEWYGG